MDARLIEDLATLAKVWGAAKFYHPWLAYKDIDWDAALVAVLPALESGAADIDAAVGDLLDRIGDPLTRVLAPGEQHVNLTHWDDAEPEGDLVSERDGASVLTARAFDPDGDRAEQIRGALDKAQGAPKIIIDLRRTSWGFVDTLEDHVGRLLKGNAVEPASRSRLHSGFAPQSGSSSGGYFSAWVVKDAEAYEGTAEEHVPISLVVDASAPAAVVFAMTVARHTGGAIVSAGAVPEPAGATVIDLGPVRYALRISDLLWPDGTVGWESDARGEAGEDLVALALRTDPAPRPAPIAMTTGRAFDDRYEAELYPSRELRLLGLFRYWNVIDRFFPYHHLLDVPWSDALTEFIPRFAEARDATEYVVAAAEMATRMQDGHAGVSGKAWWDHVGRALPELAARTIEGRLVVTYAQDPQIAVGDIVAAIDGEPVEQCRARLAKILAHSTPQGLLEVTDRWMFLGEGDLLLRVEHADGRTADVTVPRTRALADGWARPEPALPTFGMLDEQTGYMDLDRLQIPDVEQAVAAVASSTSLVLDMRGYPNGTAWVLGPWLASRRAVAARFSRPETRDPLREWDGVLDGRQILDPSDDPPYEGRVVCLIDARAVSQAEHTCLYLEAATDVTFIGSATNGTNGDVTGFWLPGAVFARFTGHDVRHGDGRQLQRVGVQPHIEVHPTIEGVRAGRDEVLEATLSFLAKGTV